MATIITDLKETFRKGDIYIQLIFINVTVFVAVTLIGIVLQLFNYSAGSTFEWLELPASLTRFIVQPWSLLTYMFMHADLLHILFNMLWLYWFGKLFLCVFSAKHLRGLYVLGGICGGLLYMVAYNVFLGIGSGHCSCGGLPGTELSDTTAPVGNHQTEIPGTYCYRYGFAAYNFE